MISERPPRSAGTTGLWDAARRPPRYPSFPPGPRESLADIGAVRAGQARRVGCFLRARSGPGPSGPGPRRFRRGTLVVSGDSARWRRAGMGRRPQILIAADRASVLLIRAADQREQRFGSPANIHLFALVWCATPAGRLDLVVPIADVPLITWFFGGQPEADDSALLAGAIDPGPRAVMSARGAWWLIATGFLVIAATAVANGALGASWLMPLNYPGGILILTGATNLRRARRREREADAPTGARR